MKTCSMCGVEKPREEFQKQTAAKDGLQSRCRSCMSESSKAWMKKNKERRDKYEREYDERNAEKVKAYRKAYHRRTYERRREARLEYNKAYYKTEAGRASSRANWQKRRALKRGAQVEALPNDYRSRLIEFYGNKCLKCGVTERLELDHVIPLTTGGTHSLVNFQVLCKPCNTSKYNRSTADYRSAIWAGDMFGMPMVLRTTTL